MANVNTVALSGNLTRDPEVKTLPSGTSVCETGIAVNRSRKDPNGDGYLEEVSFFDLVIWSGFGELVGRKARKGDSVVITGRLEQQRWTTDNDENRSKVRVTVDQMDGDWQFRSKDEENQPGGEQTQLPAGEAAPPAAKPSTDDDILF